ncbi:MAG: hypothetical protein U0871_01730 [Gemmataceae bacterium]
MPWEAKLTRARAGVQHSWLIRLGTAPLWRPPEPPSYRLFSDQFRSREHPDSRLPDDEPADAVIAVAPRWLDWTLTVALGVWLPSVIVALLYPLVALHYPAGPGRRSCTLHVAVGVATGGLAAAVTMPCLWWLAYWLPWLGLLGGGLVGMMAFGDPLGPEIDSPDSRRG